MLRIRLIKKYIKRFLGLHFSLLLILIIYSWIVVSNYKEPPVQMVNVPPDYSEYCGVVHIHTKYSDGAGTPAEVIEAAKWAVIKSKLLFPENLFLPAEIKRGLSLIIYMRRMNLNFRRNNFPGVQS
ncbi:MAG: hypothetical protein C4539_10780 [Ignavibacteriales bacterium]|nr:MAG: hypothetical protein C4539_10780 [Ignavibacteriales bacterium]